MSSTTPHPSGITKSHRLQNIKKAAAAFFEAIEENTFENDMDYEEYMPEKRLQPEDFIRENLPLHDIDNVWLPLVRKEAMYFTDAEKRLQTLRTSYLVDSVASGDASEAKASDTEAKIPRKRYVPMKRKVNSGNKTMRGASVKRPKKNQGISDALDLAIDVEDSTSPQNSSPSVIVGMTESHEDQSIVSDPNNSENEQEASETQKPDIQTENVSLSMVNSGNLSVLDPQHTSQKVSEPTKVKPGNTIQALDSSSNETDEPNASRSYQQQIGSEMTSRSVIETYRTYLNELTLKFEQAEPTIGKRIILCEIGSSLRINKENLKRGDGRKTLKVLKRWFKQREENLSPESLSEKLYPILKLLKPI